MKNIGIHISLSDPDKKPIKHDQTRDAYKFLFRAIAKLGHNPVLLRGVDWFEGGSSFSRYWALQGDEFVSIEEYIKLDVLFNRGRIRGVSGIPILNSPEMDDILQDKGKVFKLLGEYHMKTLYSEDEQQLTSALEGWNNEMAVVKSLDSSHGDDVHVGSPNDLLKLAYDFPVLVQEYVESSEGIPGLVEGRHDLRIILLDGEVVSGMVRTPPEGGYKSNIGFGGRVFAVNPEDVPSGAVKVVSDIDQKYFSRYSDRLYSVDMMRGNGGSWYVVECNHDPTLRLGTENSDQFRRFLQTICEKLVSMLD